MKKMLLSSLLLSFCILSFGMQGPVPADTPSPYSQQIDSILSLMSLEEKVGQMTQFTSGWDVTGPVIDDNYENYLREGKVGSIFNAHTAAYNRKLQQIAVEETRLGIPLIFGYDVIHGYKTIFPISLGETASWDLEAIGRSARVAATEASAAGLHWTFAPMVDISFDPRWGRISEAAGEDVFLGQRVAEARVKGIQGDELAATNTLAACVKHFAAYGAAQAGRDYHTVDISERVLRDVYLPPFKAAIDAGARTVMTSFNELNGIPATGNRHLLQDILIDEWGFDGFVVTDYTSINEMIPHGVAETLADAARLAANAGVHIDMQGGAYMNELVGLVEAGEVEEAVVDNAVRRILRVKFELGLFDDPYSYFNEQRERETIMKDQFLEDARDMARKSMVLLKNDHHTLPLAKNISNIALIGPLADTKEVLGSWHGSGSHQDAVSVHEGLRQKLGKNANIRYAQGAPINEEDRTGFEEAIRVASAADVIVMVLGEHEDMGGEAASRSSIELPGLQEELFLEMKKLGKPLVVLLMNSRPLAIQTLDEEADAILETWFLGTQAGNAIADVLFGDYNPSGKLPVTFPRNLGQVPIHYNMKNTGRPIKEEEKYTSKYLDVPNTPLYPFGYGLSYTQFEYAEPQLEKSSYAFGEPIRISVSVKNTGELAGEEVVQLYVRDLVGSVTRPVKELKGFKKVMLQPGEEKTISFTLTHEDLAFHTAAMEFVAEPGDFKVFVGGSSDDVKEASFTLEE
jgi:beta-glucosidase